MPMPSRLLTLACVFVVASVASVVPGCVKYRQTLIVHPDGSGRMSLVIGMSNAQLAQLGPEADPFAGLDIASLSENLQGFVAFSEPRAEDRDGYRVVNLTGYFENVSQLGFAGGGVGGDEGFDAVSYTFEEGRLVVLRPLAGQAAAAFGAENLDLGSDEVRRVLAPAVAGMELEERFVLPGKVTAAGPLHIEGREAFASVQGSGALAGFSELLTRYAGTERLEIHFEPQPWPAGAEAAWKQELEDAKTRWERLVQGAR